MFANDLASLIMSVKSSSTPDSIHQMVGPPSCGPTTVAKTMITTEKVCVHTLFVAIVKRQAKMLYKPNSLSFISNEGHQRRQHYRKIIQKTLAHVNISVIDYVKDLWLGCQSLGGSRVRKSSPCIHHGILFGHLLIRHSNNPVPDRLKH